MINILKRLNLKINNIVKILIAVMAVVNAADGIVAPMFAIFVSQKIEGADLTTIGYAVAIYWVAKSILQIPISRYLDITKGENDDLFSIMVGIFIFAMVYFLYIFARTKFDLFLLQGLLAFGGALFIPPWFATFTRHIDRFKISFEWSLNSGLIGVSIAGAGALSGIIVSKYGFNALFIIASSVHIIAFLAALLLYKYLVKLNHAEKIFPEMLMQKK